MRALGCTHSTWTCLKSIFSEPSLDEGQRRGATGSLPLLLPEMVMVLMVRALMKSRTQSLKELTRKGLEVVAAMVERIAKIETRSKRVEEVERMSPNSATLANQNHLL